MNRRTALLLLWLGMLPGASLPLLSQSVLITEFMAANSGTLFDEDGESSDWIELFNAGTNDVNLAGWYLTDNRANPTKWRFPATSLPPSGFLVVFASDKNRTIPGSPLHTSFALNASRDYLALVRPDGFTIASEFFPNFPPQTNDVSYGYPMDGFVIATNVPTFLAPTPGAPNLPVGFGGILPEVEFSHNSRTFSLSEPFQLTLSTLMSNAIIYYAFGTNLPTPASMQSFRYTNSIPVANTLAIRARAFAPGLLPGPVTTKTFIGLANQPNVINFNSDLPVMIIHNYGQGTIPAVTTTEHYVFVQTFETDYGRSSMMNTPTLSARGTIHTRGSSTLVSSAGKAQFRLEIQDEFDEDLEVPLLGLPPESDWILHAPNNFEPALFHDPLALQLARDMGQYASRTRFFELFLKDDSGPPGAITAADYHGIYVLEESIKRDKNRVNIAKLESGHINLPEVTGGYLFSIDRGAPGEQPLSAGGGSLNWIEPSYETMIDAARAPQVNYIRGYLDSFNTGLTGPNYTNVASTNYYGNYIDIDSWVTRHIHEVTTFNVDALRLDAYFFKDRDKKIEYGPAWDYDRTQGSTDGRDFNPRVWRSTVPDLGTDFFNFSPWWHRLFTSPDFWQRWIDTYQDFRKPGNALHLDNIIGHINRLADEVREAQPREQARWSASTPRSGSRTAGGFTYNFGPTVNYQNEIDWKVFWYSNRLDFMDTQFLAQPILVGDTVPGTPGPSVRISAFDVSGQYGTVIYYTLDGTDPRASNSRANDGAFRYMGPFIVDTGVSVAARAINMSTFPGNLTGPNNPPLKSHWSGLARAGFTSGLPQLRITEIMYHPMAPAPDSGNAIEQLQFIELKNSGATPIVMGGIRFTNGIDFTFPSTNLPPGQYVLVVKNRATFEQRYGPGRPIAGEFGGSLAFSGERLTLVDVLGRSLLDFEFSDRWHDLTDGPGLSLVGSVEDGSVSDLSLRRRWKPSRLIHGSPGQPEPASIPVVPVVINELLSNPLPPFEDAVEILNPTSDEAKVSFWYLTDDFNQPRKFLIPPGTFVPAFGFLSFDENTFNPSGTGFSFNADGDGVYLYSADEAGDLTGYVHGFRFVAARTNETFGRYLDENGAELFVPQSGITFGQPNSGPVALPVGLRPTLALTELMFDPGLVPPGNTNAAADMEFIEIKNIGPDPIDLGGAEFVAGVSFAFPVVILAPGQYALVVRNRAAFASCYGTNQPVIGEFSGGLGADGERVALVGSGAEPVLDFTYDSAPFPLTKGFGFSLVLADEQSSRETYSLATSWRTGSIVGGSPGWADPTVIDPILINEVLTHIDLPQVDAIELFNPIGTAVNVGGWWLSDEFDKPKKFRIPAGTMIPAGGFVVFTETQFNATPGTNGSFSLSSKGDKIYLFSGDGTNLNGYFQGHSFSAAASGVSFGRYVNSQTNVHFVAQAGITLGAANAGPRVGPIVISEINYHPVDLPGGRDNEIDEFIELANIAGSHVPLYDPANPTNTWRLRGSSAFNFPPGVTLPAGGYLLLVRFNPAEASVQNEFRSRLNVHASVPIFGPYVSRLDNAGGRLHLLRPVMGDPGEILYTLTDEVEYRSNSPWPIYADGTGASLQRIVAEEYGNDPVNWIGVAPSAGAPYFAGGTAPSFTAQPQSITNLAGRTASFSVGVAGTPPFLHQWRFNGGNIYNANSPVLTLANVQPRQVGYYSVIVINSGGIVESDGALLSVVSPLSIVQQPLSRSVFIKPDPRALKTNEIVGGVTNVFFLPTNVTFSVSGYSSNSDVTYQWRFNGVDIPSATNASLTVTNVQLADEGDYSCAVSDTFTTTISANARLVPLLQPVVVRAPANQMLAAGSDFTASVEVTGNPLPIAYSWRRGSVILRTNSVYSRASFLTLNTTAVGLILTNNILSSNFTMRVVVFNEASLAAGSPGVLTSWTNTILADLDLDGIPDVVENDLGLASTNAADAALDADGDGMSNRAEYIAGTDPTNRLSYLKVDRLSVSGPVRIEFLAVSNRTYAVEAAADLGDGPWTRIAEVVASATNRLVEVLDPTPATVSTQRVYRLVTPRTP